MSKKFNLYLGKAGQLAAMSYFLMRGWNVATPEVDVGDDLFVVEDKKGIFYRVQVKTAQAIKRRNGYSVQFNLPLAQIQSFIDPDIYYVFVVWHNNQWSNVLIISREDLADFYSEKNIGSVFKENLILYVSFQSDKITCSEVDFTHFNNNFEDFPLILH